VGGGVVSAPVGCDEGDEVGCFARQNGPLDFVAVQRQSERECTHSFFLLTSMQGSASVGAVVGVWVGDAVGTLVVQCMPFFFLLFQPQSVRSDKMH